MKTTLSTLLLVLTATFALAHEGIEIGPNGGRILDFSKDESMHGEAALVDGKFHVRLFDKAMKPVPVKDQVLTVTRGDRNNPEKLAVEKHADRFIVPTVNPGQWIIFQYRETPDAKAITARFEYDTKTCEECKKAEWLCTCAGDDAKKKKK